MDSDTLVRSLFNSGSRLIEALDRVGTLVSVAAWVRTVEEQRWTLYIASKDLEEKGLVLGYRTLSDALRLIEDNLISVSDIKLIGNDTGAARDLQEAQLRYPVTEPQLSRLPTVGGVPIELAFVYPSSQLEISNSKQTKLKFVFKSTENPMQVISRFQPGGQMMLNKTEWRGKAPRSCCIDSISSQSQINNRPGPTTYNIEVAYKPKGCITYTGETRYDGWTALMLDRTSNGILLDGQGNPLPEGNPPVYREHEVYKDMDFNELNFGDFVGEFDIAGVRQFSYETVVNAIQSSSKVSMSIDSKFMAQRRRRPGVRIILSEGTTGTSYDGYGLEFHNINESTLHLRQVVLDKLLELFKSFLEGRTSLKTMSNKDLVFVLLDDVLIDNRSSSNRDEPDYDCLKNFVDEANLYDISMKLMQLYELEASVVTGESLGLLLSHKKKTKN